MTVSRHGELRLANLTLRKHHENSSIFYISSFSLRQSGRCAATSHVEKGPATTSGMVQGTAKSSAFGSKANYSQSKPNLSLRSSQFGCAIVSTRHFEPSQAVRGATMKDKIYLKGIIATVHLCLFWTHGYPALPNHSAKN